jgi:hypothetical protein
VKEQNKMSKSIAEEILEPLELIQKKLVKLSKESREIAVSYQRVEEISIELDGALSFLRKELEAFYPDEEEDDCPNCGGKGCIVVPDGEDDVAYEQCQCSDTNLGT